MSDEGGFWASTGDSPRAARQPRERQKPTEVGEASKPLNCDKTQVNKGRFNIAGYPRRGEGRGEPLKFGILVKDSSNFVQETPPV